MTSPYYNNLSVGTSVVNKPIPYDACDECGAEGRDGNPVKLHLNNILIKRFTQHYTKNMTTLSKK